MELKAYLDSIQPLDEAAMAKARERQAQLAKPPGSLGRLEDLSVQLAGITGSVHNKIEMGRGYPVHHSRQVVRRPGQE